MNESFTSIGALVVLFLGGCCMSTVPRAGISGAQGADCQPFERRAASVLQKGMSPKDARAAIRAPANSARFNPYFVADMYPSEVCRSSLFPGYGVELFYVPAKHGFKLDYWRLAPLQEFPNLP